MIKDSRIRLLTKDELSILKIIKNKSDSLLCYVLGSKGILTNIKFKETKTKRLVKILIEKDMICKSNKNIYVNPDVIALKFIKSGLRTPIEFKYAEITGKSLAELSMKPIINKHKRLKRIKENNEARYKLCLDLAEGRGKPLKGEDKEWAMYFNNIKQDEKLERIEEEYLNEH
ncbi:MAG: hypothetical protein KAG37_04010 [Flavobacteriales bacterium]|nr:hypothetical protein [Flavobacteriales bacterium]